MLTKPLLGAQIDHTHHFGNPAAIYLGNEGSGSIYGDSSGNVKHGTINGATWVGSPRGGALIYNGSTAYVNLGTSNNLKPGTGDFTISAWISTISNNTISIIGDRNTGAGGTQEGFYFRKQDSGNGNVLYFAMEDSAGSVRIYEATTDISDGIMHFAVGVREGSVFRIYLDGIDDNATLAFTLGGPIADVSSSNNVNIGRFPNSAQYWDGLIDGVRIDPRVLSAAEISQLFHTPYIMFPRPNISRYFVPTGFPPYPRFSAMDGGIGNHMLGGIGA